MLSLLWDLCVSSLVLAGVYTLVALAWVMVFRATGVLNFATGEMMVVGAYIYYWLSVRVGLSFGLSLAGALVLIGLGGALCYHLFMRRVAGQPMFAQIILTMGLATVLWNVTGMVWGTDTKMLTPPFPLQVWALPGGAFLSSTGLAVLVVALLSLGSLVLFLRFSRWGIQMRAAAEKPLLAGLSGIPINRVFALGWLLAAAVGTLGGIGFAHMSVLGYPLLDLGIRGMAPALVGGLDSVKGVLPGAIIIALVETMAVVFVGGDAQDAAAFTVLLIMLAVRPHGLFGTPEIRRV